MKIDEAIRAYQRWRASMSQHTSGPWKVINGMVVRMSDGAPIAYMDRTDAASKAGIFPVERDNNARLIAKAPEMFRLIKLSLQAGRFPEVGDGCEQWNPAEVARALLREIEGETP